MILAGFTLFREDLHIYLNVMRSNIGILTRYRCKENILDRIHIVYIEIVTEKIVFWYQGIKG